MVGAPYGGFTKRNPERWAAMMSSLIDHVRRGVLKPLIHRRFRFDDVQTALNMVAERKVIGKCLLLSERGWATQV